MRIDEIGEDEVVHQLLPFLLTQGIEIPAGEDDAAVYGDGQGGYTVVSCDASVEGIHFDLGWMSPEDAGWRALALALGDLAAKGASPTYALAMAAVPGAWEVEDLVGLYRGMAALGQLVKVGIVGGDTSATAGPAVIALTVIGATPVRPLARSEALPGWTVGVTGPLGGAALALRERRVHRFEPLLAVGRRLNEAGLCCGDISDGLLREMDKFLAYSGTGCEIRLSQLPVVPGVSAQAAAASGEEAELIAVGPEDKVRSAGLTVVGVMTADRTVKVLDDADRQLDIEDHGFRHFA